MASHISQEYYDEMCLRFNLKDCHVSVNQLSRKKMAKKLKELIARCQAELEAGQEQQANQEPADVQPVDHQEDQVQPYPMVEIEEEEPEPEQMTVEKGKKEQQAVRRGGKRSVKQSIPDPASSDDAFSDYSHDNYPKSSPESFGSEPVVILPADHHHKPVLPEVFSGTEDGKENESSNHRKVQKEAEKPPPPPPLSLSLKSPGEAPTRRPSTLNETGYFFINRPSRTSPDYDTYFMQKYDVNPDAQVELDQLDPVFIEQAKAGLVKWKSYFKNPALELARLQAAAEPEDDPEYVEEEDDEIDVDEFLDEDEEEGSDFEKELVAITRSQEATLKRERFSPTEQQTSAKGKRGRKRQPSGTQKKEGGDEKEEEEDGVPEPKVKKQRKSRIVMHKCNDCNYTTSCIKDLKLHRAKHESGLDPIFCQVCGTQSFSTFDDERHKYEAHEGPAKLPRIIFLSCKSCRQTFEGINDFNYHVINHIRGANDGYQCTFDKCSYICAKYNSAADHVKTHTLYKCTFCDKGMQKMEMLERHCSQDHKQFGRPFQCCLCDYRCAVFGLMVKHKEESHAILMEKDSETCRFCGSDVHHVFTSLEEKMEHLAIHANFEPLFRCKEPGCDFTADLVTKFHDHNFENHIATVLDEEVSWAPDVSGLVQALTQAIKKKFKKQPARKKPNVQETDSAVQALAGLLSDPEYTDESRSFVSGDLELDAGILSSGDFAAPPATAAGINTSNHHQTSVLSEFGDDEDGENLVPKERPKRKSAIEAQSRLQKQKEEETAERLRKERRRAQMYSSTPQPSPSHPSSSTTSSSPVKQPSASSASSSSSDPLLLPPPAQSVNIGTSDPLIPGSFIAAAGPASQDGGSSMFSSSPSMFSSPTKGQQPIENIIRSLDMQENDAIPTEILNDVFMDPNGSADTVSPFVYDPETKQIIYQGYPVLDESGVPIQVTEEELGPMLNMLYSQSGLA